MLCGERFNNARIMTVLRGTCITSNRVADHRRSEAPKPFRRPCISLCKTAGVTQRGRDVAGAERTRVSSAVRRHPQMLSDIREYGPTDIRDARVERVIQYV